MSWMKTSYYLQSNDLVDVAHPLLKHQMPDVLFGLKEIFFFKLETLKLLTVYVLEGERMHFSVTGNRIEIRYISSHTLFASCPPHARTDNYGNSARTVGQNCRYLPHRSQTCSLRKRCLMEERLSPTLLQILKHFCGLSIAILSVR